jgi:hypothetical protein
VHDNAEHSHPVTARPLQEPSVSLPVPHPSFVSKVNPRITSCLLENGKHSYIHSHKVRHSGL